MNSAVRWHAMPFRLKLHWLGEMLFSRLLTGSNTIRRRSVLPCLSRLWRDPVEPGVGPGADCFFGVAGRLSEIPLSERVDRG